MPVSKNPRRKAAPATPRAKAAAALPDRAAMESYVAATPKGSREDAIRQAQDVIYDAWEQTTHRSCIALARKALTISPLCADAYNILADAAGSDQEARDLYASGCEAGQLALGPEGFDAYAGHFWGFHETRPYMRARAGLAATLIKLGEEAAAIDHFRAMLELNPSDNQGIRYLLLGRLLKHNDEAGVKQLLAAFKDEWTAHWLYTRALLAYREGPAAKKQAERLVRDAWKSNQNVPEILAGTRPAVADNGYITMGGEDEASDYVSDCGQAWHQTPGAVEWLTKLVASLRKKPKTASQADC